MTSQQPALEAAGEHGLHGLLSAAAYPEQLQGDEVQVLNTASQPRINETHRFVLVVLGCFGMVCASFGYAFNLISGKMQSDNHFTQRDMSTISTVGLVLGYFMLPFGFIFDYFGPIPIAVLAIVTFCTGTLCLAFTFSGAIAGSVVRLSVFNGFMNIGLSLFDLVSCMTVLSHFPSNKGAVVALLKTFVGIGSALVGCIQIGFFPGRFDRYFFFLTALAGTVGIVLIVLMRLPPYHLTGWDVRRLPESVKSARLATRAQYLRQRPQMRRFYYGFGILVFLIVFLPTQSALASYLSLPSGYTIAFAVVTCATMGLLTVSAMPLPFLIDARWRQEEAEAEAELLEDTFGAAVAEEPVCERETSVNADVYTPTKPYNRSAATVETDVDYIAPSYQTTFFQSLCTPQLYALWWSIFCVVGTEFVVIYNARFIMGALSGELPNDSLATMLTVLNGVGSAVGRLTMSYLEYWAQNRPVEKRIPITLAPFLPAFSVIITIVLFLTLPAKALPLPYVTAAIGNGFVTATIVLTTRTIYVNDPAKHYNFFFLASSMAALLLNRFLYGEWYSVQAEKQKAETGDGEVCYGKSCVLMTLLVLLGLCCTTFATTLFAHLRYTRYCKSVLAERARLREEACAAELGAVGVLYDGIEEQTPTNSNEGSLAETPRQ